MGKELRQAERNEHERLHKVRCIHLLNAEASCMTQD